MNNVHDYVIVDLIQSNYLLGAKNSKEKKQASHCTQHTHVKNT